MKHLRCAIGFLAVVLLLQVTLVPVNASNSTVTTKTNETNVNATEIEASKKDKRQAQRGYTDVPLDEGFNLNSSPPPPPAFESDRPPYADNYNDLRGNYLGNFQQSGSSESSIPNLRDIDRSFFPQNPVSAASTRNQEVPAAATIQERINGDDSGDEDGKPIPGEAGRDYPTYASIPKTSFSCKEQQWPGYYADTNARCQVFWICQKNRMDAFLCPNGTLFNQQVFVCDWWFNVDCNASPEFYSRNQYLYAGRGVGIDGKPTGLRKGAGGGSSSTNVFVNAVVPRPSGVNSNPLVNQVQSSNQISRVATVSSSSSQNKIQSQNPELRVQSSNSFFNNNGNNNQQIQQHQQQQHQYSSNQNQLTNRMQKNQGPTNRPTQNSNNKNQLVGGYQTNKQVSLNSQSEFDRRGFSATSQNQLAQSSNGGSGSSSYQGNGNGPSSTRRPESFPSPSSPRPSPSQTPKLNVNIDTKSNKQAILGQHTISSTGRPHIQVNTEVPLFGPGSSTYSPAKLIASSQNIYNSTISNKATTRGPTVTTIKSTSSTLKQQGLPGFLPNPKQTSSAKHPGSIKSEYGLPNFIPGRPTGSSTSSTTTFKYGSPGYFSPETTTQVSKEYGSPGHNPGTPQSYVSDRGGFGKESRQRDTYVSSSTQSSTGYNTLERNFNALEGQRSNQFSNINGQRENMYSSSRRDTFAEFPYSPSQQKNKQKLLELQSSKGITNKAKDIFSYPHFHGQRSNTYSESDSVSYITNNNKHVAVDHSNYSQRKNSFAAHQNPQSVHPPTQIHGHNQNNIQNQQQIPIHQNQVQHQQVPAIQNHVQHHQQIQVHNPTPIQYPQQPLIHNQQQNHQTQQYPQQSQQQIPNQHQVQNQQFNNPQQNHQFNSPQQNHQFNNPQQHQQLNAPQQNRNFQHQNQNQQQYYPQQQQNQHQQPVAQQSIQSVQYPQSHTPTPSPPFHQKIVKIPSQNLQLPASNQYFGQSSKDGYTSLQSGSFISIATTSPPFSKQILKHSVFQPEHKPNKHGNNNAPFVTTGAPRAYSSTSNSISSPAPSAVPQYHRQVSLSTTLRPPPLYSTAAPFTNTGTFTINKPQPTPYTNQNSFIAAPTQAPYITTSPGHRQNPYLPHNHGKRPKNSQGLKFSNSVITTTIKYPEGTGNLKLAIPSSVSAKTNNLVDFSYSATPTSSSAYLPSSTTTPYPSVSERFQQSVTVSSSTSRSQTHSSPSPQSHKDSRRIGPSARLAGSVVNKSTSSSSAIYVDNSDTAESVSTPVSVSPSASPSVPVSTSNFGLRISSTAKKRMAGAWQNYFGGKDKDN